MESTRSSRHSFSILAKCGGASISQADPYTISLGHASTAHPKHQNIIILGGGIAGLSTARYLLHYDRNIRITIIDKNIEAIPKRSTPYAAYDKQQVDLMHFNIPSRRNGNVLCPSLTVPWTTRSLWSEAFLPLLKSYFYTNKKEHAPPTISFDISSLMWNRDMVC
jgi:hypothetical protein